jgi:P27 family predicted phage terminase small subunit
MSKRGPKPRTATVIPMSQDWTRASRGLTSAAKRHFEATVTLLRQRGALDQTSVEVVRTFAINLELRDTAYEQLCKDGAFTVSDRGNVHGHPAEGVISAATSRIQRLAETLGLTLSSAKAGSTKAADRSSYGYWADKLGGRNTS